MDLQRAALNHLEPFIALSKSATSPRAAADLVTQATSAPHTFVFAELLQTPNIQALRNSEEHVGSLRVLEIFAWGSLEDYESTPNLPLLNPSQTSKLRLLSLLPLLTTRPSENPHADASDTAAAARTPGYQLSYPYLIKHLSLDKPSPSTTSRTSPETEQQDPNRTLEALLSSALPLSLLSGHIDPLHSRLSISSTAPLRDLPPASIPRLTHKLNAWETRCAETISTIEAQISRVKADAAQRAEIEDLKRREMDQAIDEAEKDALAAEGSAGSPPSANISQRSIYERMQQPQQQQQTRQYGQQQYGRQDSNWMREIGQPANPSYNLGGDASQDIKLPGLGAAGGPPAPPKPAPIGPERSMGGGGGGGSGSGSNKRPAPSGSQSSANEGEGMEVDRGITGHDGAGVGGGGAGGSGSSAEKKGAKKVFSEGPGSSQGSGSGGGR
ncbi:MAG: hypothetical protein M1831_003467 [Alyxoria varia]|nr:MAG: hypothetical protein M1831_003467 [Alyxoria varia]